ncbi:hypothetical protein [Pseudochelatococcus contaminans]|uniref:Tetratricopeptide (TPR) repeat protein n=1 Tax=Pseudochelatococcus contaminans TaxID=1538103 RepID=A0A7W5Z1P0_9HYPH|nr:hypothetical protein [Pseudochelatococcus contaminans]MBB3808363.1 tetratricopeptide (TPR) repeat protein [Pseudochelatococcus contaminans]
MMLQSNKHVFRRVALPVLILAAAVLCLPAPYTGQGGGMALAASATGDAPDSLYERLAAAQNEAEARDAERAITRVWLRSGSPTADLLATRAHTALAMEDAALAIELLDRAIALAPDWMEAYARRGQIFAAIGDDERAVADFNQVLAQNQRHFVVLTTLAAILDRSGLRKGALTLYDKALAINPQMDDARKVRDRLKILVEGRPL